MQVIAAWLPRIFWGYVGTSVMGSVAKTAEEGGETLEQINKAVPWIVGGLALYLVTKGRR